MNQRCSISHADHSFSLFFFPSVSLCLTFRNTLESVDKTHYVKRIMSDSNKTCEAPHILRHTAVEKASEDKLDFILKVGMKRPPVATNMNYYEFCQYQNSIYFQSRLRNLCLMCHIISF